MKILFITSSRIGDAVISCGILEHLRLNHPEARITVACGAAASGVFARLPGLERLIIFEKQRFDAHWFKLWGQLFGVVWDVAVDVRGSGILLFLAARSRKILRGGRRPGRRYEQLGASLGFSPAPLPVVWTAPEDDARAAALLGDGPVLALGPTANWGGKIWPPDRFVTVAQALGARIPGLKIAVFAGPGEAERALAAPVLNALPGAIDAVGSLSLVEAAACLRHATLYIGNDSGLMHIAAAAGAPTLGLFGRSRADEYAPAGRRTAVAVAPGPDGEAPMEGLTVDTVLAAAEGLLCA
jgi:ADP-heptose:LPS heptosyltransferase